MMQSLALLNEKELNNQIETFTGEMAKDKAEASLNELDLS